MSNVPEARPASTVVLLRDTADGMETLLLKRNKALVMAGGLWVFPGGALDAEDLAAADGNEESAACLAAAREAEEESGLRPRLDQMVQLSHWTTPVVEPKRFRTWIYAAPLDADDEVVIDGGEIHDHRWLRVSDAVAAHESGELGMLPPTYITLLNLSRYENIEAMLAEERHSPCPEVFPIFSTDGDDVAVLFRGDAGYAGANGDLEGSRHRAVMRDGRWHYEYRDVQNVSSMVV